MSAGHSSFRAALLLLLGLCANGQINEFLPEIDVHYKASHDVRVTFQAKQTREGGDPTQAEIGPSITFYLKPSDQAKESYGIRSK